jgi:protein-S-isoprenylcysteine O-methyltransferase Ste14
MKNIFATIIGFFVASATVYIFETIIGHTMFPLPEGVDPMDMEWIKDNMDKIPMGSKIFVVIAHFAGIIAGMFMAAQISRRSMVPSYIVGVLMLAATFATIFILPKELWFTISDAVFVLAGYLIGKHLASKQMKKV